MPIVPVLAVHAAQRSRDGLRPRRQNIGLPHGIDWLQLFAILIMPEGPAVARRRVLQGCTQLVDRSGVPFRLQRSIHTTCCLPTPLGIEKDGAGFHVAILYTRAKGNPWLRLDRKSTRLNSSNYCAHRMPSS